MKHPAPGSDECATSLVPSLRTQGSRTWGCQQTPWSGHTSAADNQSTMCSCCALCTRLPVRVCRDGRLCQRGWGPSPNMAPMPTTYRLLFLFSVWCLVERRHQAGKEVFTNRRKEAWSARGAEGPRQGSDGAEQCRVALQPQMLCQQAVNLD